VIRNNSKATALDTHNVPKGQWWIVGWILSMTSSSRLVVFISRKLTHGCAAGKFARVQRNGTFRFVLAWSRLAFMVRARDQLFGVKGTGDAAVWMS
jgi:hypothetical protein